MVRLWSLAAAVVLAVAAALVMPRATHGLAQPGQIAFESNRTGTSHIYVTSPTSGGKAVDLTPNDKANNSAPSWSPNGQQLTFTTDRSGRYSIWLMNADGTEARPLTKSSGLDVNPVWSPQGDHIAFTSNVKGQWDVYLTTPSGGRQQLTNDSASEVDVSWAPNDTTVVYDRLVKGTSDLWAQSLNGPPKQLTRTPSVAELNPTWSPTTDEIAYDAHNSSGQYDIYVLEVQTGKTRRITNDAADDLDPSWSPDGKQLLFTKEVKGDYEVYAVNADGTNVRDISRDKLGLDFAASWQPVPLGASNRLRVPAVRTTGTAPVFKCGAGFTGDGNDNTIPGNGAVNYMCGLGGNDTIYGGGGGDYINGGNGSDKLHGGDGNDWIKARPETPIVKDWIWGEAGTNNAWIGAEDWADRNTYCRL